MGIENMKEEGVYQVGSAVRGMGVWGMEYGVKGLWDMGTGYGVWCTEYGSTGLHYSVWHYNV